MPFDQIKNAALRPGKLVPLVLNMLPGEPVVHLEHLGDENASYFDDAIAKANAKAQAGKKGGRASRRQLAENRDKNRETLAKHSVRHLEARHSDGRAATDADIPEFMASVPPDVVDTMIVFAFDAENWRERSIDGDARELAEK